MNNTSWVAGAVVIIVLAGGVWFLMNKSAPSNTADTAATATTTGSLTGTVVASETPETPSAPKTVTVSYGDTGFSPKTVSINKGDTVTFINNTTKSMWVGADEHPTHTEYDGTGRSAHCAAGYSGPKPFDQCAAGSSFSFTFDKAGSFDYHNHAAAQFGGTVVVQ